MDTARTFALLGLCLLALPAASLAAVALHIRARAPKAAAHD
jgi:hypothetical protein